MTEQVEVALAADAAYVRHAAVAAASIARTTPATLAHLLVAPDVTDDDCGRFVASVEACGGRARIHPVDERRLAGLPTMGRIGTVMWYRLLLPSLLHADRVLYVDADTYAVADCTALVHRPLDGALIGAAHNVLEPRERARVAALDIPGGLPYFNSGVLVLDLAALRATEAMERVLLVARRRADQLLWPDQDALNIVLGDRRQVLHPRFNVQNSLFHWGGWATEVFGASVVEEALASPVLIHFEGPGPAKPWHVDAVHPWRDAYRGAAARTPWGPLELEASGSTGPRRRHDRLRRRLARLRDGGRGLTRRGHSR